MGSQLLKSVKSLDNSDIGKSVINRLSDFKSLNSKSNNDWFCELCFCILTANSKARTAIAIQNELGYKGFISKSQKEISQVIRNNHHRFHNNKSKFIVEARKHAKIKDIVVPMIISSGTKSAREWIVENIKGIGYKEASHFLRNVGYEDIAILDRHILNLMVENNFLKEKPKSLTKKTYLQIENDFERMAKSANMSCAKLDLFMWYMKGGDVLK